MMCVMLNLGQSVLEHFIVAQAPQHRKPREVGKPTSDKKVKVVWEVLRNQLTGTFLASNSELRTSCNILQWTARYLIASGRS